MNGETNGRRFKDDRVINLINTKFITLKDEDMKRNNKILHEIVQKVVTTLKEKNEFFNDHFRNIMFVGSYYKGTKVGKPEEFDFDLIIQLPMKYELIKCENVVPGFTKLKVCSDIYKPGWERHSKILNKWVTSEGYLNHQEFFRYMESSFSNRPDAVTIDNKEYKLDMRKSGPAFTLCIKGSDSLEMSVDLVPVLEFNAPNTPPPVPGDFCLGSWFAVPKAKRGLEDSHLHWRMSFYHFEKDMLKRSGCLKPVIRQLKKLRDTENWNSIFPSYHIETLSLHRMEAMKDKPEMQNYSMMEHFMEMLGQLKEACETGKISNFWDRSDNLLADVKSAQLAGIKGRLIKIIKQLEKDPLSIADYVLTEKERSSIKTEMNGFRNSGKSNKAVDQPPVKGNEVELMRSKSCNITLSRESSSTLEKIKSTTTSLHEENDGIAQIINMLKAIQSDMADTKDAVMLLTRRVASVEEKVDVLLSRSNADNEQQLNFGPNSIYLESIQGSRSLGFFLQLWTSDGYMSISNYTSYF